MLARIARFCYQRKWLVIIVMIAGLFVANGVAAATGNDYHTDFKLPDSESKEALDLVNAVSPIEAGFVQQVVIKADQGINDPAVQAAFTNFIQQLNAIEPADPNDPSKDAMTVTSPYDNPQQIASQGPFAGKIAFAELHVSDRDFTSAVDLGKKVQDLGEKASFPAGVQIEYGGEMFQEQLFPASEALGVLAAVIILIVAFGSVLAMGLPIGAALLGLGTGMAFVAIASNALSVPEFGPQMAAMIGLGVGIDYALFIVTRFREGLQRGLDVEDAIVESVDTSGRAVFFAGLTVIIALSGLFLSGLSFVQGLAISAMLAVGTMVIGALVFLPALLGVIGRKIDITTYRGATGISVLTLSVLLAVLFGAAAIALAGLLLTALVIVASFTVAKQLKRPLPERTHKPPQERFWYRWSRFIQNRPWPAALSGVALLLLLAVPLVSIRLGFGDLGNLPTSQTPRRAYDLIAQGFGPGSNGPLMLVVHGPDAGDQAKLATLKSTLEGTEDVAFVTPAVPLKPNELAIMTVYPKTAPQDEATTELVHHLRDDVIPGTGVNTLVGGFNAASVDFAGYLGQRLALMIGFVLILSFVLLMIVFRSLLVPLKAVVVNLLSIGAAYGFVVAVFQWGWAKSLIGLDRAGPIDAWVPMMLFAIVFGLSMDYEVFLLSRIKEQYDATGDNGLAVADGLATTARVITAAALIMVSVFSAFALGDDRSIKLFGLGMGVAVLIDATIVRMLLVPATMELLGARNWWAPNWLLRVMPRVNVEGRGRVTTLPTPATVDD